MREGPVDEISKPTRAALLAQIHNLKATCLQLYRVEFFSSTDLQVVRQTLYMAGAELAKTANLPCRDCTQE